MGWDGIEGRATIQAGLLRHQVTAPSKRFGRKERKEMGEDRASVRDHQDWNPKAQGRRTAGVEGIKMESTDGRACLVGPGSLERAVSAVRSARRSVSLLL
jgi:hypothetical protein